MTSKQLEEEILEHIYKRYGSLLDPDFHWVQIEYDRQPHEPLKRLLSSMFLLEDVTDLNNDVSFVYELESISSRHHWTFRISMVGPYATLLRHGNNEDPIVDGAEGAQDEDERFVVRACKNAGYQILSKDILSKRVELRLFDTDPERVRYYQALFSDVDFMPGEYCG